MRNDAPERMILRQRMAVSRSDPGARPMPRSIRPGAIASSTRNCSATFSAE
jgi:hypothetical protein